MTTRPEKRPGSPCLFSAPDLIRGLAELGAPKHQCCSRFRRLFTCF